MKRSITLICMVIIAFTIQAQKLYHIEIETFQESVLANSGSGSDVTVPNQTGVAILGGAYNKEGLGRYLIFNGSRLAIDSMTTGLDGYSYVKLRREDGRNFFNVIPLISAKLIPIERVYQDQEQNQKTGLREQVED